MVDKKAVYTINRIFYCHINYAIILFTKFKKYG